MRCRPALQRISAQLNSPEKVRSHAGRFCSRPRSARAVGTGVAILDRRDADEPLPRIPSTWASGSTAWHRRRASGPTSCLRSARSA